MPHTTFMRAAGLLAGLLTLCTTAAVAEKAPQGNTEKAPAQAGNGAAGNRIEVSNNTVSDSGCDGQGVAVNSVNIDGARLQGRTVVIAGKSAKNIDTRDCPARQGQGRATVNSINIR